jgi:hypothetical protein
MQQQVWFSPRLVAVVFAPTAFALWAIGMGAIPLGPVDTRIAFQTISLIQLFVAIALYEHLLRRHGAAIPGGRTVGSVGLAFVALLAAELSQAAVAHNTLADVAFLPATAALLQQLTAIALPEELWFRGLWMRAADGRPLLAILGGALGFGLYHLHQGA